MLEKLATVASQVQQAFVLSVKMWSAKASATCVFSVHGHALVH